MPKFDDFDLNVKQGIDNDAAPQQVTTRYICTITYICGDRG